MRDITLGETHDFQFNTTLNGEPITLAGTPAVAAYPDNSVTQITAGITLTVDHDSITGVHNVRVVATAGNGYAAGTTYTLRLSAGTVNGVSQIGKVVGEFSIGRDAAYTRLGATPPTATENADALLNRDLSAVTVTNSRSPINALRFLRNKWTISAGTLTVMKEDDTTSAWTAAVTTSAGDPVSTVDPN